jgi:hypothetical protein
MRAAIAIVLAIAALLLLAPAPTTAEASGPDAPDLAFLAGSWRADFNGATMDEYWLPPLHGSVTGVLRLVDPEGNHRMLELLSILPAEDGRLLYRMRHFDGAMRPWASEAEGPFEGLVEEHTPGRLRIRTTRNAGSARELVYEAPSPDALRVTIRFTAESGREDIVINFARLG